MALLSVTEFEHLAFDGTTNPVLAPQMDGTQTEQGIDISASSTPGEAFQANTRFIMVDAEIACCIAIGPTPTAVNTRHRMGAGSCRFYGVKPGQKIAVIAAAA